jgi:hypothetical protein
MAIIAIAAFLTCIWASRQASSILWPPKAPPKPTTLTPTEIGAYAHGCPDDIDGATTCGADRIVVVPEFRICCEAGVLNVTLPPCATAPELDCEFATA